MASPQRPNRCGIAGLWRLRCLEGGQQADRHGQAFWSEIDCARGAAPPAATLAAAAAHRCRPPPPPTRLHVQAVLVPSEELPADAPTIRGYDFNQGCSLDGLLESMLRTGLQASALGQAINEVNRMVGGCCCWQGRYGQQQQQQQQQQQRRQQQQQQQRQQQQQQQQERQQAQQTGEGHHKPRMHPWQRHGPEEASGAPLDAAPSSKICLMFDANGTVTSHTSMRKTVGLHQARPGTHHLRRLKVSPAQPSPAQPSPAQPSPAPLAVHILL